MSITNVMKPQVTTIAMDLGKIAWAIPLHATTLSSAEGEQQAKLDRDASQPQSLFKLDGWIGSEGSRDWSATDGQTN